MRGVDVVEISGRGGRWEAAFHDVLIAIDESESTLVATGRDIDGNGRVGRNRRWNRHVPSIEGMVQFQASGDPGDAVVSAEVAAARRLIAQLDPETMRVGLVSFAGTAWVDAPLGHPAATVRQLDVYTAGYHDNGTSIAAALGSRTAEQVGTSAKRSARWVPVSEKPGYRYATTGSTYGPLGITAIFACGPYSASESATAFSTLGAMSLCRAPP